MRNQTNTAPHSNVEQAATTNHWVGEKYHENSEQQKFVADMLIGQYSFKESDNVLDVGCGDGKITAEIAQKAPYGIVVGVDPSDSMINFANARYAKNNLCFRLGKGSSLTFSNEFDVITSFSSLHWEPKQKEALLCFKAALKPGGTILLAIPGPDPILRSALNELCNTSTWSKYFKDYQSPGRIWTANEYAQLLLETEFEIRKIEVVYRPHICESTNKYMGLLRSMLPHLSRLPSNLHGEFINVLTNLVVNKGCMDEKGRLKFEVKVLEIIAQSPRT
jgi:trans-aconitate 2-methyltransferase